MSKQEHNESGKFSSGGSDGSNKNSTTIGTKLGHEPTPKRTATGEPPRQVEQPRE
jgi:hypothetical protein